MRTYCISSIVIIIALTFIGCSHLKMSNPENSKPSYEPKMVNKTTLFNDVNRMEEGSVSDGDEDDDDDRMADREGPDATPAEIANITIASQRTAEEIEADRKAQETFPLVYNEMVESWIRYFTSKRGRPVMERWLARSTRYIPMMKQVLKDEGLPEDLIYLAMIESGFNPKAKSWAKAVGPWQFIKSTGQRYGLQVEYWLDERRDYRKSTFAAAQYLKELHQVFGSWYLAAAGYNAGEGKVLMAVRRERTRNFWELARGKKKNFKPETKNYVPKIIAAALVSKNPEKYGFTNIPYEEPLRWENVSVPAGVSLRQVAKIVDGDIDHIELLNSELKKGITPPSKTSYPLRLPPEKAPLLASSLEKLETKRVGHLSEHTVRRGDTMASLAKRYGTDVESLMELNQLTKKSRLKVGRELTVPIAGYESIRTRQQPKGRIADTESVVDAPKSSSPRTRFTENEKPSAPPPLAGGEWHVVQSGDSLWSIARRYGITVEQLKQANQGKRAQSLKPGDQLNLPKSNSSGG